MAKERMLVKTPLTKEIEKALFAWNPTTVGGIKLNTMRPGFSATEVPVENGTTTGGFRRSCAHACS